MKKLADKSCVDFANVLASKEPVPGGGGAAALAGALGAALCSMVGNFTVGKKKYAAVESDVKEMLEKAKVLREQLLEQIDADAAAFAPLAKAYGIPKDDSSRDAILEEATLNACKAPREIAVLCCQTIDLLNEMLDKGSTMLISDVGCGALLCKAALESAAMNVFINTKALKNCAAARRIEAELGILLEKYRYRAQCVVDRVFQRIQ